MRLLRHSCLGAGKGYCSQKSKNVFHVLDRMMVSVEVLAVSLLLSVQPRWRAVF